MNTVQGLEGGMSLISEHLPIGHAGLSRRDFIGRSALTLAGATVAPYVTASGFQASTSNHPQRVIIDTDPGVDDALAILLALASPELRIEGVTPVAGNVPLDLTLPNALRILDIA